MKLPRISSTGASASIPVLLALLLASSSARADVLLVLSQVDDSGEHFWWSQPQDAKASPFETLLSAFLRARGESVIDPATTSSPPNLSRVVYGRADLGTVNAINLASLYGASRVIHGRTRIEALSASPIFGWPGVRVSLSLHVHSTNSAIELLAVELEEKHYASTEALANEAALKALTDRLAALIDQSRALSQSSAKLSLAEPVLVLSGMSNARAIVDVKKQLKTQAGVDDVIERWSTEGAIALELNPGVLDAPESVFEHIEVALRGTYSGFSLQELSREADRVEVVVLSTARTNE